MRQSSAQIDSGSSDVQMPSPQLHDGNVVVVVLLLMLVEDVEVDVVVWVVGGAALQFGSPLL